MHDFKYCVMQINTLIIRINDSTKTSTKFSRATLPFGLIVLMIVIVAATPMISFAQQAQNATQNTTTQGFGGPPTSSTARLTVAISSDRE